MILHSADLPWQVLWACHLVWAVLCLNAACRREVWACLAQVRSVILAVLLLFLWGLRIDVADGASAGMSFHLIGMVLAAVVLRLNAAWLLLSAVWLATYGQSVWQDGDYAAVAPNVLLALLPAWLLTPLLWRLFDRCLPRNLFVFIFAHAFVAAGLSMVLTGALTCAALWVSGRFAPFVIAEQIAPVYLLLLWGEAFLSGLLTAVLVAFKPDWLERYSDEHYLPKPPPSLWQ